MNNDPHAEYLENKDFLDQVNTKDIDDCWDWIGDTNDAGYGVYDGTTAHRYMLLYMNKDCTYLPEMRLQHVIHKCDNPLCCNPAHLEFVRLI